MRTIEVQNATDKNFEKYGWIISEPSKKPDEDLEHVKYWDKVVFVEDSIEKLNVGFMKVMKRPLICTELELIPSVEEFYICLDGEPAIMFVAPGTRNEPDLSKISAFNLNGNPFVIRRGIWHWAPYPLYNNSNYALFTSGGCMITVNNKVTIDPDAVIMSKLKEQYTVNSNANG
jgi:ureidoglycolate hydrolase